MTEKSQEKERRRISILQEKLQQWISKTPVVQECFSRVETSDNYGTDSHWVEVRVYGLLSKTPPKEVAEIFQKRVGKYMRKLKMRCEAKIRFEKVRGRKPKKRVIKSLPATLIKKHDLS